MNKNGLYESIKKQIPKKHNKFEKTNSSIIALAIIVCLFITSAFMLYKYFTYSVDSIIVQDLKTLQKIFKKIDQNCKIVGFDHVKNYVDFLTVKEFIGSQVGSMNIINPKNWKGPYLKYNPTVDGKQYLILKNKDGYYIVPDDGVVLSNGKKIGTDIVLDEKSDMEALLSDKNSLKSLNGEIVAKISIGGSYLKNEFYKPLNYLNFKL